MINRGRSFGFRYEVSPHTRVMLNRDQAWDGRVVEVRPNGTFEFDGVPQGEPVHLRVGDIEVPLVVVHDIENITIPLD